MTRPPIIPRAKLAVASHGPTLAAALLIISLLGFGAAVWTFTHPPSVEVTDRVETHTVGADVETSTVVTGNTSLWERGTVLTDKPVYPLSSAPNLTVRVHTTLPPDQTIHLTHRLTLVYQATKDDEVFWQTERVLIGDERTVIDGNVTTSATLDIRDVQRQLETINADIVGIGRAEASLRLNVSYEGSAYAGTISETAPLAVLNSGYWVGGTLDATNTHQTPVTREETLPPDTTTAAGYALIGLVGAIGAAGTFYAYSRRLEPAVIAEELDRDRYREWISTGQLGDFMSGQDVAMASLRDLVDVAIDSAKRVVHDRQRGLYAVVDDGTIYYYDPYHSEVTFENDLAEETEPELEASLPNDGGHVSTFDPPSTPSGGEADSRSSSADRSDSVSVDRTAEHLNGHVVITYRLTADDGRASRVTVEDRLPDDPSLEGSLRELWGFRPETIIDRNGRALAFSSTVDGDEPTLVKFGFPLGDLEASSITDAFRTAPAPTVVDVGSLAEP